MSNLTYVQRPLVNTVPVHCADCGMPFKLGWFRQCDRRPRCNDCYAQYGDSDPYPVLAEKAAESGMRLMATETLLQTKREALGAAVGRHYHEDALDIVDLIEWCEGNDLGDVAACLHDLVATESHWINATRDYANASAQAEGATA
ncbi:MAG: hypothetical protein GY906_38600 [bacterium]|nr:hypothetical protein [bacterium]